MKDLAWSEKTWVLLMVMSYELLTAPHYIV